MSDICALCISVDGRNAPTLTSVSTIYSRYQAMDLPHGTVHSVCLCINQASMDSILDSPMPSRSSRRQRKRIPFVLAVTGSANQPRPSPGVEDEEDDCQGGVLSWLLQRRCRSIAERSFPLHR